VGRSGSDSSTSSKGEWSPEKANDLYCLLNKKRIERGKERRDETRRKREEGRRFLEGTGVTQVVMRYHS